MSACGQCQVENCENPHNQSLWEEECDDYHKSGANERKKNMKEKKH